MDKKYKFYASHDKQELSCHVWLNKQYKGRFIRYKDGSVLDISHSMDPVTHDLEMHSFMRLSLQWLTDPQTISAEELFELDNINI